MAETLARVHEFAADNSILACDSDTARLYGQVRDTLRRKGRMIPIHELWIAALALQYNLVLITRDGHFGEVDGLQVEAW